MRRLFAWLADVHHTAWGERYLIPREGDMVVCADSGVTRRWQRRDHTLHELGAQEHPWVYSQFLNRWEPATIPTDATFLDARRALHSEAVQTLQRQRRYRQREKTRRRQQIAWARARRR